MRGKEIIALVDWHFDEEHEDNRQLIQKYNMKIEEILEDKIERYINAIIPPKSCQLAMRVFSFLRQNDNHVIVAGGMSHFILGLDKDKLIRIAKEYGLELGRYMLFVNIYENKMLKKQNRQKKETNA